MRIYLIIILSILGSQLCQSQHPCLTLTEKGVQKIKASLGTLPLFDKQLELTKEIVKKGIQEGIDVPIPKDMAGGYTHERHKANWKLMNHAGNLYQITGEKKYATYVRDMLMAYAEMYPTLSLHPTNKSYATGKIFWQCLNDANWLVFTSQAYDCIYDFLTLQERDKLENDLFIPYANFLSIENPRFFNRIHNHSTWANAAVGMIALAMKNDSLLNKALYGLQNDGIDPNEFDNDGGFIKKEGVTTAGFLAQMDLSFSSDGYFSEGPYYLRYSIFPFLVFSHALHNNRPELDIFNYRDGILKKATHSLLKLTNAKGEFFPINDAQKGMTYQSYELVNALDLIYHIDNEEKQLLDWAALQQKVVLNEAGYDVASALSTHKVTIPKKTSYMCGDGVTAKDGGVAVLRLSDIEVLFKYSTQGMGHGHYDRLSYAFYDQGEEVIQDYGAVRWVNVDQKAGGRYLPENKTFGKQSIGHNTAVVNQGSHYKGKVKKAEKHHPELYSADFESEDVQFISAKENNAYSEATMHRFLFLIKEASLPQPLMLDIMKVNCASPSTVELPLWHMGHTMQTSFDCQKEKTSMQPLGDDNGYQHIWKEGECIVGDDLFQFNWFSNDKFYTQTSTSNNSDVVIKGRAGANDPNFNLRPDPVLIHQKNNVTSATFFNIIEAHGHYNRITEIPINPYAQIKDVKIILENDDHMIGTFSTDKNKWTILISHSNNDPEKIHKVKTGNMTYEWKGVYKLIKSK